MHVNTKLGGRESCSGYPSNAEQPSLLVYSESDQFCSAIPFPRLERQVFHAGCIGPPHYCGCEPIRIWFFIHKDMMFSAIS